MADAQSKRLTKTLHVGTMGWSYIFWKGTFYPENLESNAFLTFYARHFGTVEVDSTFYRIPRAQTIIEWKKQTPKDFLFSLKFPQKITHVKMLRNCQDETHVFLERVALLEEKLGVLLLQFPPMFRQQHFGFLAEYLPTLPKSYRYAVEVRNKSLLHDELYTLLRRHNIALVWVDNPKIDLVPEITADFVYARFEGDRKTVKGTLGKIETDRTVEIQTWVKRLYPFLEKETPVFGYFSKFYSGYPVGDTKELMKQVNLLSKSRKS